MSPSSHVPRSAFRVFRSLTGSVTGNGSHRSAALNSVSVVGNRSYGSVLQNSVPEVSESSKAEGWNGSSELIELEDKYSAHNYHPLPVVFARAKGVHVWDPEGRHYLDFLSAYSAVNQGHSHPKIIAALKNQVDRVSLSSRAFHNDQFPPFAKLLSEVFGYESMLPMNTGAEGVETAIKLARKWGYERKGIPKDKAVILSCCGCFHGRTLAAVSMSCDPDATRGFGPLLPNQAKVDFGDVEGVRAMLEENGKNVAAFLFEPIQGEAGVIVPPSGYLKEVERLCAHHNVLMIADEIQTGIARTGKMLACEWEDVRPDILILGKALGAGVLPVSAVLADRDVMSCIRPGEHGSTFGGNPLACAVATAALQVVLEENLAERAAKLGEELRSLLRKVAEKFPRYIKEVRGRGLLNAVEMDSGGLEGGVSALDICMALKERGILAKPTHHTIIRLAPPLTMSSHDLKEACDAFEAVLGEDMEGLILKAKGRSPSPSPSPCDRCGRIK